MNCSEDNRILSRLSVLPVTDLLLSWIFVLILILALEYDFMCISSQVLWDLWQWEKIKAALMRLLKQGIIVKLCSECDS